MADRLPTMYGRYYTITAVWRGSQFNVNVFRPKLQLLQRSGAQRIVDKIYPGSRVISYWESDATDTPVFLVKEETEKQMKTFKQFREHCGCAAEKSINDKKVYSREHPEAQKNVKKMQKEDWQKVNRKDKTDGLSQKAVNAYRRENPGSKLQTAVTEKKPTGKRAKRRKSFCSRMKGMKNRLTSAKTARDPDSRINKALRRWNCR